MGNLLTTVIFSFIAGFAANAAIWSENYKPLMAAGTCLVFAVCAAYQVSQQIKVKDTTVTFNQSKSQNRRKRRKNR